VGLQRVTGVAVFYQVTPGMRADPALTLKKE
jgi:hypothetical protein